MASSFVAKYPDRVDIIPDLIDIAIEEMEHFKQVYDVMAAQGISLNHEIQKRRLCESFNEACTGWPAKNDF